jgi:creatinine amidohydrolase
MFPSEAYGQIGGLNMRGIGSRNVVPKKRGTVWFDELTMKEAQKFARMGRVIIIPVGSVEEHGGHLPLCTDSLQPESVALEVAGRSGCLVAPPLRYGVCNSTRGFPGTISVGFESLYRITKDVLEEFVRNGFRRILVLSGHAGQAHMAALRLAAQEVVWHYEGERSDRRPRIMVCSDYDFAYELKGKYFSDRDGHAGTIETSRVMAIRPDLVKMRGRKSFPKLPRFEVVAQPERYFPSGVVGDPTVASRRKGRMINRYVVDNVVGLVEELMR